MTYSSQITYTLHKLVFMMDKLADTMLQSHFKITFSQYRILMAIDHEENMSQHDIAVFWDTTEAAVSRQIELLSEKKLIVRRENKKNRREHVLSLTLLGKKKLSKASMIFETECEKLYAVIPHSDQKIIVRKLDRLLQHICKGKGYSFCTEE